MRLEFHERKVGMSKSKVFRKNATASSAAFASRQYGTMMSLKPAALSRLRPGEAAIGARKGGNR